MQNSIYKIKYLLFLSWDWEAWCLTRSGGVIPPHSERNTAWNRGRKCFPCLGAPNNLIRPWWEGSKIYYSELWGSQVVYSISFSITCSLYCKSTHLNPIGVPHQTGPQTILLSTYIHVTCNLYPFLFFTYIRNLPHFQSRSPLNMSKDPLFPDNDMQYTGNFNRLNHNLLLIFLMCIS